MEALTQKQLLRLIKKATANLCDMHENRSVQSDYWDAIRSLDRSKLEWYWSMGETTRHQVLNVNEYLHGKLFGFTEVKFNDYGWLENSDWTVWEEIELRVKHDKAITNEIILACGLNGVWTYGLNYNYGTGSGGGYHPSVYNELYKSREICLNAAIKDLKDKMLHMIQHATQRPDPSNYNIPYMTKVIDKIEKEFSAQTQLALF